MSDQPDWYDDEDAPAPDFPEDAPQEDIFEVRTFDTAAFVPAEPEPDADASPAPPQAEPLEVERFALPVNPAPEIAVGEGPAAAVSIATPRRRPRRRARRPRRQAPTWWVTLRTVIVVVLAAVLISTVLSFWTRPDFFTDEFRADLNRVQATQRVLSVQPTPLPTESRTVRIGVIAGHSGRPRDASFEVDPGAVCPDGLTELEINQAVAREVVASLRRLEYEVDLLSEFDERLQGYQADVLISIHSNDCQDYGAAGTGFSVASASARQTTRGEDELLRECLVQQYGKTTGLPYHEALTYDMTEYHTFGEVAVDTPTAIIELGFMRNDRALLTTQQPLLAQGIVNGILCFLQPDLYSGALQQ